MDLTRLTYLAKGEAAHWINSDPKVKKCMTTLDTIISVFVTGYNDETRMRKVIDRSFTFSGTI